MKSTPEQLTRKRVTERRKAWRDLRGLCGDASPAPWLSDETLERLDAQPARCVTAAKVRAAVRLANAAPDLLAACIGFLRCYDYGGSTTPAELSAAANAARVAIAKAKGQA